ncbi:D-alanyl-D-alanine carboxypeptidase/D-alanyl-D-alanine-endopeptidase [Bacteroidales bacterium OttesenSCG-928-M11]|nr:D-alanyl-D-alanine carboxypeptidase/D-alanyl-D-alanine-endopeptidase [Bacteroidales bacterium OttesenSCG-928-M11]
MKNKISYYFFLFLPLFILSFSLELEAQNQTSLRKFLNEPHLKHAAIGLKIVDLSSGEVVLSHNENTSFTPGSTMKIVTTATALDILGKNFSFQTKLLYDGEILDGILLGDLIIEGFGDPTLGSEFLSQDISSVYSKFFQAINNAGIKKINGRVIVLDQHFGYEGISGKWMWEDIGNAYSSAIYGISIYDNTCKIELQSFQVGKDTKILNMRPNITDLQLINEIKGAASNADNSYVSGIPFSNNRRLYGTIPQNRSSFIVKSDIPDPGLLLAREIKQYLTNNGIAITQEATTNRLVSFTPTSPILLTAHRSPSLASIVRVINERSNNHYAEHVYQYLTKIEGVDILSYWKKQGITTSSLFLFDGSGISAANAVSVTFLTDILIYMNDRSLESDAFYESFPIAGKEGTVVSFLRGTCLEGKAKVKSGSLTNVQSYSGYINSNGKRYAFAIIVNQYNGTRSNLRKSIESLLISSF